MIAPHASPLRALLGLLRPEGRRLAVVAAASAVYGWAYTERALLGRPLARAVFSHAGPAPGGGPGPIPGGGPGAPAAPATADEFLRLGALFAAFTGLVAAMAILRDFAQRRVILRALLRLRLRIAEHLLGTPLAVHSRERVGDLVARVTTDIRASEDAVKVVGSEAIEHAVLFAFLAAGLFRASPPLALLTLLAVPAIAAPLLLFGPRVKRRSARSLGALADLTERLQQVLSGIKVVKCFHSEDREEARYASASEEQYRRSLKVARSRAAAHGLMELVVNAGAAGGLVLAAALLARGALGLDPETVVGFAAVAAGLYTPIRGLSRVAGAYQESLPAVGRACAVLDLPPESPDPPGAGPCPPLARGIVLRAVTFAYPGTDRPALRDVTIEIPAGGVVGIVGESGAGKSTLLDLLLRLADPAEGVVEWDGADLRTLSRRALRGRVALVAQDPFLFHASVAENIRLGRPGASDEDVVAAARAADVHEVVAGLPEGYATVVGERGSRLSGGERQRVTIARALLRDPSLLLLDEATAALDADSERRVLEALRRLRAGRTTVWVAHRVRSLEGCDEIVVLEGGRVAERGRPEDLLRRGGAFARLAGGPG
ncbi:MAG: ABC transporter ATP-binding protein/permease [Planctomycetales bacterium]|nr:ABC transporter ATP-binding protein/permease [Planctomycetales bacterium]